MQLSSPANHRFLTLNSSTFPPQTATPRQYWRCLRQLLNFGVRSAKQIIVHSCVAGWPIPMGWLVTPIALIQGKFYVLVVESAPWCLEPGTTIKIKDRIIAYVSEIVNRWCVNNAGLTIFTQSEYQQSLLTKRQARGHVIHAASRTARLHPQP